MSTPAAPGSYSSDPLLAAAGAVRLLPRPLARRLGGALGELAFLSARGQRRRALEALAAASRELAPGERRRLARRSFRYRGALLADAFPHRCRNLVELCRDLRLEGWENLHAAAAEGRGVIAFTARLGAPEIALLTLAVYGSPATAAATTSEVAGGDLRELRDLAARWAAEPTADLKAEHLAATLAREGRVAFLLDPLPGEAGDAPGIALPFLGLPHHLPTIAAEVSLRTGAPAVPLFAFPEPDPQGKGRYRCAAGEPVRPAGSAAELTRRYAAVVEEEVRRHPEAWWWPAGVPR